MSVSDAGPPLVRPPDDAGVASANPVRRRVAQVVIGVVCLGLAAMWIYALGFASKESVNRIGDRGWAARAEQVCDEAELELAELDLLTSPDPVERAELVDRSTDILEQMLDDIVAVPPADDKGKAIVPDWVGDYRTLLGDRRAYADRLRAGEDGPFTETAIEGVPISERLETFAGDNDMPSCAPPRGSIL